ncbi:MAG: hypothetical protein AAF357_12710 [Verrucomicrobiota bacterium]
MSGTPNLKEHPTFHRNSMIVTFLLGGAIFVLSGISIHAENGGRESPIPGWIIISNFAILVGWMLYRAILARPRCPSCGCRDTKRLADYMGQINGSASQQNWRRYRCDSCADEFVIPGLGSE